MKHLKTFENIHATGPEVGDWVYCEEICLVSSRKYRMLDEFLKNNIGRIVDYNAGSDAPYLVKYENVPDKIIKNLFDHSNGSNNEDGKIEYRGNRRMQRSEIKEFGKDKDILLMKLNAKKYNL